MIFQARKYKLRDCDIIVELSEGIQFLLKFLESVKKKLMILFAVFLIAAVIAYPVTDYIINDAIERSLPHNVRNKGLEENFDPFLMIYDGPITSADIDIDKILRDTDIKISIYTEPTDSSELKNTVQTVIENNSQSFSSLDVISAYILGESNMTLGDLFDIVLEGGMNTLELEGDSEIILYQMIPYDPGIMKTNIIDEVRADFENITGRSPISTITYISKDDATGMRPAVVYTKPLEVPLLKLKMSIVIAIIAILPVFFYMAAKETGKYVNLKKLNIKEKIPISPFWLIMIAVVLFISFLLGAIYAYLFMAPLFIQFLYLSAAASGAQATYSIYEFVNFISMMVLIFGFIFEFPLVIFILNRLGIVQKRMLTKYRRHAYVLFVILAAIVTPPDVISQIIVAVPMIFFYELSVIIVKIFGKRDP